MLRNIVEYVSQLENACLLTYSYGHYRYAVFIGCECTLKMCFKKTWTVFIHNVQISIFSIVVFLAQYKLKYVFSNNQHKKYM